ncbi:MAG TPA: hypothetical protein VFU99_11850 [Gaiellaceae bacterium]|nr:hypothetical protein [Gaiellaceae bacterium]
MNARMKRPTPAFVVALVALFFALGGTAGAIATQAVPLAKRALVADNAKKVGGQTAAQLAAAGVKAAQAAAAAPGPASTAASLVTTKTQTANIAADDAQLYKVSCDSGQKVIGGGFSSDGPIQEFVESRPENDTTWSVGLINFDSSAGHAVTLYAVCIK